MLQSEHLLSHQFICVEYPHSVYPDYCNGWIYVLPPELAHKIGKIIRGYNQTFFKHPIAT